MTKKIVYLFFLITLPLYVFAQENLFYVLRSDSPYGALPVAQTLNKNADKIDGLIAQAFKVDSDGSISGYLNPDFLKFTRDHHIKLYAMVTNVDFSSPKIHKFLQNNKAQENAITTLSGLCKENKLAGLQIDFEHIPVEDKYTLNQFAENISKSLHQNNCQLSFTLFPRTHDFPDSNDAYWAAKYNQWSGAYDYQELAQVSDFVTLMAYDQHTGSTPPGPVAGLLWDKSLIQYALNYIPPQKLSLGVPTYSDHWLSGTVHGEPRYLMENMSYEQVTKLMKNLKAQLTWDTIQAVPFTFFIKNHLNEYIFAENARSFKAKIDLAKQYKLRGISVWRIGVEDPQIWDEVSNK